MTKVVVGINDLSTLHPEITKEADFQDPSKVQPGSRKKLSWKCKKGHFWSETLISIS